MQSAPSILRGFTVDRRVWLLSSVAIGIGLCATILAALLLHCIAVSTNIFYYHRLSINPVPPSGSPLGNWMVLVPVVGGLIVGLMARFGSDKIRGHGIPEAIGAILLNRAKVDPKIAILKPVSAAVAIGSGGPFGAEGPIIMAGGAVGSLIGQWMYLTDAERTTLLVAGAAAAGMSATFDTPVAWRGADPSDAAPGGNSACLVCNWGSFSGRIPGSGFGRIEPHDVCVWGPL